MVKVGIEGQRGTDLCGSVGWALFCGAKWSNSLSGHMAGLQVPSPVGAHRRGKCLGFLSHINVFLSLSPFLPLFLKINK